MKKVEDNSRNKNNNRNGRNQGWGNRNQSKNGNKSGNGNRTFQNERNRYPNGGHEWFKCWHNKNTTNYRPDKANQREQNSRSNGQPEGGGFYCHHHCGGDL
uniref:Uncharacterized protein n=1 Tax=Corethron hystrix TaxID=216773 RepID=A0A7S1FNM5_9STRA